MKDGRTSDRSRALPVAGDRYQSRSYAQSYFLIRRVVGLVGVTLPFVFIIGEACLLRGQVRVRGSLSAYYHTSMRDIFVGGLCVIGFFLMTYMAGQIRTWTFWLSSVAGAAVLGVAFLPTWRPGLPQDAPRCGTEPMPAGCSPIQQQFGEPLTAGIHFVCAVTFILALAWISFLFARGETARGRAPIQRLCGRVIILAVVGVIVGEFLGFEIWGLTPLYLGEVTSVWAFATSWLSMSATLRVLDLDSGGPSRGVLGSAAI